MNKRELFNFYCNHFANWISGGTLVNRGNLSSLGIRPLFSQIVTKQYIKKVICIYQFPVNYFEPLGDIVKDIVSSIDKSSKSIINNSSRPILVDINSDDFTRKMADANSFIDKYNEMYSDLTDSEKLAGKNVMVNGVKYSIDKHRLQQYQDKYDSFKYTYEVVEGRGSMSKTFTFIELLCPNQKNALKITKDVCEYLSSKNFDFKELSANSSNFMSNFCPASKTYENENKEFKPSLMSDENLSYLRPFNTDGFIGDGHGQLIGMNVGSKTPFILNFFESGLAQIIAIIAPAGYGKTLETFQIALSMLGSGVHVSALDIKGKEWKLLKNIVGGISIDISEESRSYVNTLRLDDIEVNSFEEANEFYSMSVNATTTVLELISKPNGVDEASNCRYIAKKAVKNLFDSYEVNPRAYKSFKRTATLRYEQLIGVMDKMLASPSLKQYEAVITKMISRCNAKFRESNVFKGKEISVKDVINSPLTIYELNRNSDIESEDESIKTFMITYLDSKKIAIRKSQGLFTFLVYEEMQRKKEFQALLTFICGRVTGSRSSNATIALLCNSIQIFEDDDMSPISSNINNVIIGKLTNERDYESLKYIGCECLEGKIRSLANNSKRSKNFFAVKYNTGKEEGTGMCKCILPENLLAKLSTRDRMEKKTRDVVLLNK